MKSWRLPQHPARYLLSGQNLPCADRGRAEAMSGECVQADNSKDSLPQGAERREKKIKNSENTTVFPRPLAWRPHRRIDHISVVISLALRLGQEKDDISKQTCC